MKRRKLSVEPLESRAMLAANIVAQGAHQDGGTGPLVQVQEADECLAGEWAECSEGTFQAGKNSAGAETHGRAVTRDLKATVDATIILDFATGTWTATEVGQCTHLGRFTSSAGGPMDGMGNPTGGAGTITAANGDALDWVFGPEGTPVITGGTGRFEGGTGVFVPGPAENLKMEAGSDGTLVITYSYVGTGAITY
jgi:hypothetical protein